MDITQILLLFTVGMLGLLTGYLVGRDNDPRYKELSKKLTETSTCTHDTAIVRADASSIAGSLLVCENCGSDYGNLSTPKK